MVRYCKQRDRSSCGPVAIINLLKFFGKDAKYEFIRMFRHITYCDSFGVQVEHFEDLLKTFKTVYRVHHKREGQIPLSHLDEWLDKGWPVVMRFFHEIYHGRRMGHFVTIIGRTKRGYLVTNYGRKYPSLFLVTRREMARHVATKRKKNDDECLTWFIRKA